MMKKNILLTNDDGLFSPGLSRLAERLREKYVVYVVAPDRERSAVSMGLTLHQPLRAERHGDAAWSVNGTPSDCVNLALRHLIPSPPDWVVSGMNLGENLSEDLFYSGTVAGAFTAFLYGYPAMAVSLVSDRHSYHQGSFDFDGGASVTERVLSTLVERGGRRGLIYNLNIPSQNDGRIHVTRIGKKRYVPDVEKRIDPRGREYFWMGTGGPRYEDTPGTDVWAVRGNRISLSPFVYAFDDKEYLEDLKELFENE